MAEELENISLYEQIKTCPEGELDLIAEELRDELIGNAYLIGCVDYDHRVMSLASTLQFLIDHPEEEVASVKRKVFHAIDLCKQLSAEYAGVMI